MSFLNEKIARRLQENDNSVIMNHFPQDDTARNLVCYIGETIFSKRRLIIMIESGCWKIQAALFFFVDNQKANIFGRNILPQLGTRLTQAKPKQANVLKIREQEQSKPEIKQWVKIFIHNCVFVLENQKNT